MIFQNVDFDTESFKENDLYIFTLGYEPRSYAIYDRISHILNSSNTLVFAINKRGYFPHLDKKITEIESTIPIIEASYHDYQIPFSKIISFLSKRLIPDDHTTVHVDYSSMPRTWYCKLPNLFCEILKPTNRVCFWYSEGKYPDSYEDYPSAGIDSMSLFSGRSSLRVDHNRLHVVSLGYDVVRTQAIISIIDPDYLVACYAYNPGNLAIQDNIKRLNAHQLSQAAIIMALHISDFSFMVSKLCETAYELLSIGDVIFIPDGPKPLIFAMSLVPDIIKRQGVTCLHFARNMQSFIPINVNATGKVFGVSLKLEYKLCDVQKESTFYA
jgi:hypothetical protein